jgi:NhaA family Na+:H+ antiporter
VAPETARPKIFPTLRREEETFIGRLLRQETVGGAVVLAAAVIAVVWANSPVADTYDAVRHYQLGPLDIQHWAADGALTLFFYLAGVELKREFMVGSLSQPADALVPVVAAVAGVIVPSLIYVALNAGIVPGMADGSLRGWAIPSATDIAFALAVLAVVGSALPTQLRAFLLTLAVVDDLIVIVIIAAFYTSSLHLTSLIVAVLLLGVFALLQWWRGESWLWYVPLSIAIWWFTHESGIHATIAGVAMGLLTRVRLDEGETASPAERLEHTLTPLSVGVAVPFFALMSAGVTIGADGGVTEFFSDPVVLGVLAGLMVGKPVGVMIGSMLVVRFTRAELNEELSWRDLVGVALLAGVGFTVALLVAELSFDGGEGEAAKTAVLLGSVLSATLAAGLLRRRSNVHAARTAPSG